MTGYPYPLTKTQIVYSSVQPNFTGLAADTLGDHATERDGFDALFEGTAANLPDDEKMLAAIDGDIADAGFKPGEFESANLLPLAADTADFTGAGDGIALEVDGALTPPTDSGGGGSGSGSGSGGIAGGGIGSGGPCTKDPFSLKTLPLCG